MDKIESAYNLIEEEEYSKAEEIGKELISNGSFEGYLILTDIAHEQENYKSCISILNRGIKVYPGNWKLWMRLGNYQSDLNQYEEAEYSFQRALYMNDANQSIIKLNKAILNRRLKRFDESLSLIKESSEDYPIKSFRLELDILNELEEFEKVIEKIDEPIFDDDYEHDFESFSSALFYIANAYFKLNNRKEAQRYLTDSIDLNRNNENSLWLRRELFGKSNSKNKYFQIMVNGDYKDEDTKGVEMEFLTWYDVVAESLDKAMEEIKEFEPMELNKESFKVEEFEIVEKSTSDPSGIYQTSGFSICQKE